MIRDPKPGRVTGILPGPNYHKEYYKKYRAKCIQSMKLYKAEHLNSITKYQKQYYSERKAERLQYMRQYREKNRDKIKKYQAEYRATHKEQAREYQRNHHRAKYTAKKTQPTRVERPSVKQGSRALNRAWRAYQVLEEGIV